MESDQKKKPCSECGFEFFITDKDKKFYESHNFSLPKRCFFCRRKRRAKVAAANK